MTIVGGVATCGAMLLAEALKLAEWFDHVAVSDLIFFQVEAVEERLVEQASLLVVAPQVQLVGILQQAETLVDQLGTVGEIALGPAESLGDPFTLTLDLLELGLDLRLGAVSQVSKAQVDEVALLDVQGVELSGELLV